MGSVNVLWVEGTRNAGKWLVNLILNVYAHSLGGGRVVREVCQ